MAPTSMSYSTSNGVIPEEIPELEADAQSTNDEEQPASTFERGEESRPRRRGGRDASSENYLREMAASMTRLELSMQQGREEQTAFFARQDAHRQEELKWRAEQDTRWAQQKEWLAQQVAWQAQREAWQAEQKAWWGKIEAYMEQQQANWNAYHVNQQANQQWQQKMEQRFSSWPDHPPPPPQ